MIRTLTIAFVMLALSACGGAAAVTTEPSHAASDGTSGSEPVGPPPSIAPFAGNYSLEGEAAVDGCAGEIVLLARGLEIDAEDRALRADVVEHDYEAHLEGDQLVATGRLDVPNGTCPNATVYERWELRRVADGLEGHLYSTWLIWPSCMRVCTVQFNVRARPAAAAPEVPLH